MKRHLPLCLFILLATALHAQQFADHFLNKTLRIDYTFCGDANRQHIYVDELSQLPTWAGRQHRLAELPLKGNGEIVVKEPETGKCLYRSSFSSLFQEWLTTEESNRQAKSFENTLLLPYPKQTVTVEVTLRNAAQEVLTSITHSVDPHDILIHQRGSSHITPHRYLLQNGNEHECIDVAILAEGYTEAEMEQFYQDAAATCESIFFYEPFRSMKERFNIVAVASPSRGSGVSVPRKGLWPQTAFGAHFDTFYSDRYLTTSRVKAIHEALEGIPYEQIILLANTAEYGGGGIYNSYTLTAAHHATFKPVVVHEFAHSFGGLADEYFYENDLMSDSYPLSVEPWEPNITTRINFAEKWQDMLLPNTPVPTPVAREASFPVGLYEGGGYAAKGIYRPADNCRMRSNEHPAFCLVCQRALRRLIDFYTTPIANP